METGALRNNPQLVNIQIVLLAERKDLFFVCQLHFPCHRGIIQNDKGELARSRLRVDCIVLTRNLIWIMPTEG